MDFKPRKLPVFNRVERKAAAAPMIADRKAACQWNGADAKKEMLLSAKAWDMKVKPQK